MDVVSNNEFDIELPLIHSEIYMYYTINHVSHIRNTWRYLTRGMAETLTLSKSKPLM